MRRHGFCLLLVVACLAATSAFADPDPVDGRPSILDTKKEAAPRSRRFRDISSHLNFLERNLHKLIPLLGEFDMFALSRDTDPLYDALVTVLDDHPRGAALIPHVKRVIYSSGVSSATDEAQRVWMSRYDLTARALADGKLRAMILDIGWRGSQPTAMLLALLDELGNSGTVDDVKALLTNFDVRLQGPEGEESYDAVRERILARSFDTAEDAVRAVRQSTLRYKGILDDEQSRPTSYSAGTSLKASRRNWAATPTSLTAGGREVVWSRYSDSTIDRDAMVSWQWELAEHLRQDSVRASLAPLIDGALARRGKHHGRHAPEVALELVPDELRSVLRTATFAPEGVLSFLVDPTGPQVKRYTVRASDDDAAREAVLAQQRRLERLAVGDVPAVVPDWVSNALVQSLAPGISGVEWLARWIAADRPASDPAITTLAALFTTIAGGSLYPRNLEPAALWLESAGEWRIVGSGGTLALRGPAVAMRLLRTVARQWDPRLAELLAPSFPSLGVSAQFPVLSDASAEMLAELHPVFRRADGQLFQVDARLGWKDETAIFTGFGIDGQEQLLKVARGDAGRVRLQKQKDGDAALSAAGIHVAATIEEGPTFRLVPKISGTSGKEWLAKFPATDDPAVAPLGTFVDGLVSGGVFVSGLWPSHVVFDGTTWTLVGHHGVRPEPNADTLRDEYRSRFTQRWITPLAPTCAEKLLRAIFPATVNL